MPVKWFKTALFNFFIAAVLGVLMRYAFVEELSWMGFRNIMNAHYHTALLGWAYLSLFALLVSTFVEQAERSAFGKLFWLSQISVIGMLFSYAIKSYSVPSILFSILYICLAYVFIFYFLRKISHAKRSLPLLFIKTSLLFLFISTIGLLVAYYLILSHSHQSIIYYASIQFFLHFQFNGWLIFAIIGILFHYLEANGFPLPRQQTKWFYGFLVASCMLTYAIAVAWSNPLPAIFVINGIGVAIQLVALLFFVLIIRKQLTGIRYIFKSWIKYLLGLAFFSFCLKILIQFAVVIPYMATIAYTVRNFVIGFIHLILLGCISSFIIAFALEKKWLDINSINKVGIALLFGGVVVSEIYLFLQGTLLWAALGFLPAYHMTIFAISLTMPAGLLILVITSVRRINYKNFES